ncbi:MAG: ASCH domain-containing protein [Cellulophaga sp.]
MKNHSAENMWGDYLKSHLEYAFEHTPNVVRFCDNEKDANVCAKLVVKGIKQATSHSLLGLQLRKEPLPKIGDFSVITDWNGKAKCIVKTTKVKLIPFFSVTDEIAKIEGEGDKSLAYWKKVHWDYYTRELSEFERHPRESMIVVCEIFEKVY